MKLRDEIGNLAADLLSVNHANRDLGAITLSLGWPFFPTMRPRRRRLTDRLVCASAQKSAGKAVIIHTRLGSAVPPPDRCTLFTEIGHV